MLVSELISELLPYAVGAYIGAFIIALFDRDIIKAFILGTLMSLIWAGLIVGGVI